MAEKGAVDVDLISNAISESIRFEELMDETDFDSWLKEEEEDERNLPECQDIEPFKTFKKNKEDLVGICTFFIQQGIPEIKGVVEEQVLEKFLAYHLFHSKKERIEVKIVSKEDRPNEETEYFEHAVDNLHVAMGHLLKSKMKNRLFWMILFYNDLSICYAGIKNSSLSRGYAEEAIRLIKKDDGYTTFHEKISTKCDDTEIKKSAFVSSNLCSLFLIAVFNQAESERRSHLFQEAEKNFRIIKSYGEDFGIKNFNYYSALLRLGIIFTDQGRGREAIELFEKVQNNLDEKDARYWEAFLEKIAARIDQAEYPTAKKLLNKFNKSNKKGNFVLVNRHAVTHQGFDALNFYVRCIIQEVSNTLKIDLKTKRKELERAQKIIKKHIGVMKDRKQKESETTAYKNLGIINKLLAETYEEKDEKLEEKDEKLNEKYTNKALVNFFSFLAKEKISTNLKDLINREEIATWIDQCEDLPVLEDIFNLLVKKKKFDPSFLVQNKNVDCLEKKIRKICEGKSDLSRIGRISAKLREIKNQTHPFIYESNITEHERHFSPEKKPDIKILTGEEIRIRLDNNEKEFDKVLFGKKGSKLKHQLRSLAEVVILKRWNSFSPGLFRKDSMGSLGGGYLVRINKTLLDIKEQDPTETIVIDPGYNFIQNFCNEGFSINEIDTIIVTHSHLDHCADLLAVMDLIFQINKRYERWSKEAGKRKRITLCLSKGAYSKFSSYIQDWEKQLKDVIILENLPKTVWKPYPTKPLEISVIETPHNDLGNLNAIGIKIRINNEPEQICLGFTGDTPYCDEIVEFFKDSDMLCVHLGSIKYPEIGYNDLIYHCDQGERKLASERKIEKLMETYVDSGHLLAYGTEQLVREFKKKSGKSESLILVGEFGEELKYGLRTDFCDKLSAVGEIQCLPADIGLYVKIAANMPKTVRCNFCEQFVPSKDIRTFSYGREDAIQYVCESCKNTLSDLQKQALVEFRITRH